MKLHLASAVALVSLALIGSLSAQVAAPTGPVVATTANTSVPDGIVFYKGLPYLIRNGRASLIDATLVPEGQLMTHEGKLVPMPTTFTAFPATPAMKGTDQQTRSGVQPIVPGDTAPPVQKGTDQQTLINPPRALPQSKTTGTGTVPRK